MVLCRKICRREPDFEHFLQKQPVYPVFTVFLWSEWGKSGVRKTCVLQKIGAAYHFINGLSCAIIIFKQRCRSVSGTGSNDEK